MCYEQSYSILRLLFDIEVRSLLIRMHFLNLLLFELLETCQSIPLPLLLHLVYEIFHYAFQMIRNQINQEKFGCILFQRLNQFEHLADNDELGNKYKVDKNILHDGYL